MQASPVPGNRQPATRRYSDRMQTRMIFADQYGAIYDHPTAEMVAALGTDWTEIDDDELIPLPDGAKLFFLPSSRAVGKNRKTKALKAFETYRGYDEPLAMHAAAAFLPPGYARTHLPAARYEKGPDSAYLPLWAYAAVGWNEDAGGYVTAAVRVDPMTHSDPENYDDRDLVRFIDEKLASFPDNRLYAHIKHC